MTTCVYVARDADENTLRLVQELRIRARELGLDVVVAVSHIRCSKAKLNQAIIEVLGPEHSTISVRGNYTPKKMDTALFIMNQRGHTKQARLLIRCNRVIFRTVNHFRR